VVALHVHETYLAVPLAAVEREAKAFREVTGWLRRHQRDFHAVEGTPIVTADPGGVGFPDEAWPLRPGFEVRRPIRWWRIRMATIGAAARRLGADQAWVAHTTWDYLEGEEWRERVWQDFRDAAGPDVLLVEPWLAREASGAWTGRGRLRNLRLIPPALHALTPGCDCGANGTVCKVCRTRHFYRTFCAGLGEPAFEEAERRVEALSALGEHRDRANPETFHARQYLSAMKDHVGGWTRWLSERT